jgi:hypothetical protein
MMRHRGIDLHDLLITTDQDQAVETCWKIPSITWATAIF